MSSAVEGLREPIATSSFPSFPRTSLDIVHVVLEEIGVSDKRTQADCSLTCRAWLPMARRYLYHDVSIYLSETAATLSGFLAFLEASPHICTYIRRLIFRPDPNGARLRIWVFVDGSRLSMIVAALPGLQSLALSRVGVSTTLGIGDLSPQRDFSLRSLMFSDVTCVNSPQASDIMNIIKLFSSIDTLHIGTVHPNFSRVSDFDKTPSTTGFYPEVRAIELTGSREGVSTGRWLSALAPSLSRIISITAVCHSAEDVVSLRDAISNSQDTVVCIAIQLCESNRNEGLIFDGLGCPCAFVVILLFPWR